MLPAAQIQKKKGVSTRFNAMGRMIPWIDGGRRCIIAGHGRRKRGGSNGHQHGEGCCREAASRKRKNKSCGGISLIEIRSSILWTKLREVKKQDLDRKKGIWKEQRRKIEGRKMLARQKRKTRGKSSWKRGRKKKTQMVERRKIGEREIQGERNQKWKRLEMEQQKKKKMRQKTRQKWIRVWRP